MCFEHDMKKKCVELKTTDLPFIKALLWSLCLHDYGEHEIQWRPSKMWKEEKKTWNISEMGGALRVV